jgi:hypothetical protein
MKLPNGDKAIVDIEKIRDYCLNSRHPRGKHKARLFRAKLGLIQANAEELRRILLKAAIAHDAVEGVHDYYGKRYIIDFSINIHERKAIIRSYWIIRKRESFPRLSTCFILKERGSASGK